MRWLRAAHGRASEVRLILTCHMNRGGLTRLLTARPTGRSGGVDAQSVNERDTSCEWRARRCAEGVRSAAIRAVRWRPAAISVRMNRSIGPRSAINQSAQPGG